MVSPHLELPTLAGAVNNLPTLMDDNINLLDQALQGDLDFVVTAGGTIVIAKSDSLRNFMFNLTGTPSAAFNLDFPTNNRYFAINNKSGETATIRIDGGAGTTVEVIDAEQRVIYIDGTDVIDITGIGVPNLETLVTLAADFAITATTLTPIDWDAETRDEGSWHDNVTDPEQMKVGEGIVDAVAKIHVINFTADETLTCKLQRYNSSDALQETLFEENREHDGSLDLVFNICVLNIRTDAGDYLTTELKSVADTAYDVEDADSYFLVRRSTTGGAAGASSEAPFTEGASFCILQGKVESWVLNVWKVIVWTESEDTDNYFGGGTVADEHIVFPFTGRYRLNGKCQFAAVTSTSHVWRVLGRLNRGATITQFDDFSDLRTTGYVTQPSFAQVWTHRFSGLIDVIAGDELDMLAFQFPVTRDLMTGSFLHIEYLGPTPP